jgi:antitoxin (DNA-binding transcriptional repressor) of toxin-antitoxin stability system
LKNNLSRYLKSVQAGEEVIVLDRETPIARIVPFRQASVPARTGTKRPAGAERQTLQAMVERGALTHTGDAEQTTAWVKARKPVKVPGGTTSLSDVFLQMRDEEPW